MVIVTWHYYNITASTQYCLDCPHLIITRVEENSAIRTNIAYWIPIYKPESALGHLGVWEDWCGGLGQLQAGSAWHEEERAQVAMCVSHT